MAEESTETKKENKVVKFLEEHPKTVFWFRFVLWFAFACGLPFAFLAYRFGIFKNMSKINLSGWGIIAIAIVGFFAFSIIKYVKMAFSSRYSFLGQCLSGFCKVIIPLACLYAMIYSAKTNIEAFLQALGCVILCELVAIPLNPMPEWAYNKQKDVADGEKKETMDYFLSEFFRRKREE